MEQAVELLIDKVTQISNTQEKILEIVRYLVFLVGTKYCVLDILLFLVFFLQ